MAEIGPWLGVPKESQLVCAVEGCPEEGKRQICLYDGKLHHHGCIHYNCEAAKMTKHGLTFREGGWALMCDKDYAVMKKAYEERFHGE